MSMAEINHLKLSFLKKIIIIGGGMQTMTSPLDGQSLGSGQDRLSVMQK